MQMQNITVVQQLAVAIATRLEKYVCIMAIQAQRHEGLNCYSIRIPTILESTLKSSCSLVSTDNYRT